MTKTRTEVVIEGTSSLDGSVWEEYEFKCKPGDLSQAPCLVTPYHYRLDWLMWFAAFQQYQQVGGAMVTIWSVFLPILHF